MFDLVGTFLQMQRNADAREDRRNRTRLAEQELELRRDQLALNEEKFEQDKISEKILNNYRQSATDSYDIQNQTNQIALQDAKNNDAYQKKFDYLFSNNALKVTETGISVDEEVLAALVANRDPVIMSIYGDILDDQPTGAGDGYSHKQNAEKGTLFKPIGTDEDGFLQFTVNGTYPDGTRGVITENGTTTNNDPVVPFTNNDVVQDIIINFYKTRSNSSIGRKANSKAAATYSIVNQREAILRDCLLYTSDAADE